MEKDPTPLLIMPGILIPGLSTVKRYFAPPNANKTFLRATETIFHR